MELLLVTSAWPNVTVPEFLDEEVHHLAGTFDRIVVAPMRPKSTVPPQLPPQVAVDYSLAHHLERTRLASALPSRKLTAALRTPLKNPHGLGASVGELRADWRNRAWMRMSLLGRADSTSVRSWAKRRRPPDIAYTFWLGAATVGLRDAWPGIPLVSRVHGGDLYSYAHGWHSIPFQKAAASSADLLAAVSGNGRDYLARKFPELSARMVVRRLGFHDLGGLAPVSRHGTMRLLSASSIDPNKRVTLIWHVANELARRGLNIEWTHLGDGPGRTEIDQLVATAPRLCTVTIKGHVPRDEVHRELRSGDHDVFMNLSLSEGAPVSLMEAQCVGMPVVATAVGGTPEVAPAELNDLVTTEDGVGALADAVLSAFARPAEDASARRDHWARNYDADSIYPAWAQELSELKSGVRQ